MLQTLILNSAGKNNIHGDSVFCHTLIVYTVDI